MAACSGGRLPRSTATKRAMGLVPGIIGSLCRPSGDPRSSIRVVTSHMQSWSCCPGANSSAVTRALATCVLFWNSADARSLAIRSCVSGRRRRSSPMPSPRAPEQRLNTTEIQSAGLLPTAADTGPPPGQGSRAP